MRIFTFIILTLIAPIVPTVVFFSGVLLATLVFVGYELIFLGFLIDVYYGSYQDVPYYTLGIACLVFIVDIIRTHTRFL